MVHSEYSHIIHALVLFEPTPPEGTCTLFTTLIFNEVSQPFAVVGIHFFKREKCKKCSKQRKKKKPQSKQQNWSYQNAMCKYSKRACPSAGPRMVTMMNSGRKACPNHTRQTPLRKSLMGSEINWHYHMKMSQLWAKTSDLCVFTIAQSGVNSRRSCTQQSSQQQPPAWHP